MALAREIREVAAGLGCDVVDPALLDALEIRRIDLACARVDALRVVLFGEFKAGKSSLVNALLGRSASGVDFLEKTAAVVRFFASEEVVVAVHLADGTVVLDSPGRFDDVALDATIERYGRDQIRRIDVGLPVESSYVLVDTPGIGGRTAVNQMLAVEGVREADVVLFCVGADSVGGSRDTGTARDLARGRAAMLVVLTRTDLLTGPNEVEDVRRWLASAVDIPIDRILPVGGLEKGGAHTGVEALRAALSAFVAEGLIVRRAAEEAWAARAEAMVRAIVEQCDAQLSEWAEAADRGCETVEAVAAAVEHRVRNRLLEDVECRLFSPEAGRVATSLSGSVESARDDVATRAESWHEWIAIAGGIPDLVVEEWRARAGGLTAQFETLCAEARQAAARVVADRFDPSAQVARIEHQGRIAASAGLGVTTAAAVGSVALSTLTGTALGAAVTGVGIPIAAVGATLSILWGRVAARRESAKAAAEIRRQVDAMKDDFRTEVLEAHVFPAIRAINRKIVQRVLDDVVARVSPFLTRDDLDRARARFTSMLARVRAS